MEPATPSLPPPQPQPPVPPTTSPAPPAPLPSQPVPLVPAPLPPIPDSAVPMPPITPPVVAPTAPAPPVPTAAPSVTPVLPPAPPQSPAPSAAVYAQICTEILREQASIISAKLAVEQVQEVPGLQVDPGTMQCRITGDGTRVINDMVGKFSTFFGHAAVEVCREAASRFLSNLPPEQTPLSLRR